VLELVGQQPGAIGKDPRQELLRIGVKLLLLDQRRRLQDSSHVLLSDSSILLKIVSEWQRNILRILHHVHCQLVTTIKSPNGNLNNFTHGNS